MRLAVILPAAGLGTRFHEGGGSSKLERDLAGKPVFLRAVEAVQRGEPVERVLLAVNPDRQEAFESRWAERLRSAGVEVVPGGRRERWQTVARALSRVGEAFTHIAVHDAARPLASAALIHRLLEAADTHSAVIPAIPVTDTLKRVASPATEPPRDSPSRPRVVETVRRDALAAAQTPQVFEGDLLRRAYARMESGAVDPAAITDDAGLVELLGEPIHVVEGDPWNLKITRPEDAELAEMIVRMSHERGARGEGR